MTHSQAYQILGIPHSANADEIKKAYRKLAKKYHPDIFEGDKKIAEERMKQINEAYSLLSAPYYPNSINDQFEQGYKQSRQAEQKWQEYEEQRRKIYEDLERMQEEMKESNRKFRKFLRSFLIFAILSIELAFIALLSSIIASIVRYFNESNWFLFGYFIFDGIVFVALGTFIPIFLIKLMKKAEIFK